jgi:hypothetical protein
MKALLLIFVLIQPSSIWCDEHSQYAFRQAQEYPNGVCKDVYTHQYLEGGKAVIHKLLVRCR